MASSLKNYLQNETEMDKLVCRFYANSQCEDSDKCLFPHVPKEGRMLDCACRYFLRSKCHFGKTCDFDHVIIVDKNGKLIVQILQQQLGARKRRLESLISRVKEPPSSNTDQQAGLIHKLSGVFTGGASGAFTERSSGAFTDRSSGAYTHRSKGVFIDVASSVFNGGAGGDFHLLASQTFKVKEPSSSNLVQYSDLVGEPSSFHSRAVPNAESAVENADKLDPRRQCANENCWAIGSIEPIPNWKMYETNPIENYLPDILKHEILQTSTRDFSKFTKKYGNGQRSLKGSTQSAFENFERRTGQAIASGSESKDLRRCGTLEVLPVFMKRSEGDRSSTNASSGSDSNYQDRIPGVPFATHFRSQAVGFDQNEPMALYNTWIVPWGRTAEEIALFSEYYYLPVDPRSRVPLYMRGATFTEATSEYAGKQAENDFERLYIKTPSGRRIGVNRQYFPNQDRM